MTKNIKILLKIIKNFFIFIIISYFLLNILLYFGQKKLIYFPNKDDFFQCKNFINEEKKEYKNTRFYEISWEKNNVIIFFHWNAWSACQRIWITNFLKKTWNTIILVEYSGYSEKNNNPNIDKILKNVEEIWEYIESKNFNKKYVMWVSIGTWPASFFTKKFKTDKLLLISPYSQLYKIAKNQFPIFPIKLLFTENFENENYLKNYDWNLLIIHWKKDKIIPYNFWEELFFSLKNTKNKDFLTKKFWTHNNLFDFSDVKKEIILFLE